MAPNFVGEPEKSCASSCSLARITQSPIPLLCCQAGNPGRATFLLFLSVARSASIGWKASFIFPFSGFHEKTRTDGQGGMLFVSCMSVTCGAHVFGYLPCPGPLGLYAFGFTTALQQVRSHTPGCAFAPPPTMRFKSLMVCNNA